jgi:hypothetical protein
MKKFIYALCVCALTSLAIAGCTEEEVKPTVESSNNGGGNTGDPI